MSRRQRRFFIVVGVLWPCLAGAFAAHGREVGSTGPVAHALAHALGSVDPSIMESGFLYDRVLPLSGLEALDGSADASSATPAQWRQALDEMRRAAIEPAGWPRPGRVRDIVSGLHHRGVVPIGILDVEYQRLRAEGTVRERFRIRDAAPAVRAEDLETARVFAAAALIDYSYRGRDVRFRVPPELYCTATGRSDRIEIDFADGRGFRPVAPGETVEVGYAQVGRVDLRVRVTRADGNMDYAAFGFRVESLAAPVPDDTISVTSSIPFGGAFASGEAYVRLAPGHTAPARPIVVIEGFDIDNTLNWDELFDLLNQEGLADSLRADGYDLVVLNFAEATDFIQANAFVTVELIQQVAAGLDPATDLVVVGASMGGLVARYALAYMEQNGLEHRTRTYLSFDAPHAGANIPLGVQYWVDFFSGQSAEAAFLLERLDTPASRQLLVYHHTTPPGTTGEADSLRAELLADFAAVGEYPSLPRRVAVANGSGAGQDQGFAAGAQIIDYEYSSFLVDIIGNVWALPDVSAGQIFDGLIDIVLAAPEQLSVTVSGTVGYDHAPGGSRNSMAQMDSTQVPYGDIVALHPDHCFIPTISALDAATTDLFYDFSADPDAAALTPFEAVYFPLANEEHVSLTSASAAWIRGELQPTATAVGHRRGASGRLPVLRLNHPNPFAGTTSIRFDLPDRTSVALDVFSVEGRRVARVLNRVLDAGPHSWTWDGRDDRGVRVASGVYFYRLRTRTAVLTRRMVLLR